MRQCYSSRSPTDWPCFRCPQNLSQYLHTRVCAHTDAVVAEPRCSYKQFFSLAAVNTVFARFICSCSLVGLAPPLLSDTEDNLNGLPLAEFETIQSLKTRKTTIDSKILDEKKIHKALAILGGTLFSRMQLVNTALPPASSLTSPGLSSNGIVSKRLPGPCTRKWPSRSRLASLPLPCAHSLLPARLQQTAAAR